MSQSLAVRSERELQKNWQNEVGKFLTKEVVKAYLCPEATDEEIFIFGKICTSQLLNPFTREAYLIKYKSDSPASIVVGKDAYFKRADTFPQYDGLKSGVITMLGSKREYREGAMVFAGETLVGAWAEVFRKDRKIPFRSEVSMAEYEGKKYNWKTRAFEVNSMWKSKPATMITKVAEVQALRKAFPQLAGMYIAEEMEIGEETLPTTPINLDEIKEPKRKIIDVGGEKNEPEKKQEPVKEEVQKAEPAEPEPVQEENKASEETEKATQEEPEQQTTEEQEKAEELQEDKKPPTDYRRKQIQHFIKALPVPEDEKEDFVKILQEKVDVPIEKTPDNYTQDEAVRMIEILKKQIAEGTDMPEENREEPTNPEPPTEEPQEKPATKKGKATTSGNKCTEEGCNKFVSKKVADYSKKKYGRIICYGCQEKTKEGE